MQCDGGQEGKSAVLMQKGRLPRAGSRPLSEAEKRCAQIKMEVFAVIPSLEKFQAHTSSRKIVAETDHKSLFTMAKWRLVKAPRGLQAVLIHFQKYSCEPICKFGSQIFFSNTLSGDPMSQEKQEHMDAS